MPQKRMRWTDLLAVFQMEFDKQANSTHMLTRKPTSTLIASPTGGNPDRNYRELAATAPYFIDWTCGSYSNQEKCTRGQPRDSTGVNPAIKT